MIFQIGGIKTYTRDWVRHDFRQVTLRVVKFEKGDES